MLREQIKSSLKEAMVAKDTHAVSTMRLIMAALKDRDIAARTQEKPDGIGDDEILSLLQSMIKQRRDSITMYENGGRLELAEQEASEIKIIEQFLPKQMSEEEIGEAVDSIIAELGASSLKDMGPTMKTIRDRYAGQMDFGKASAIIKARLA
ncbi:GatB/YqeY domain-containing protein [Terasakiella sp. A23]|uniref:GatB/YqeY domain-containing protein n=1 Tax=Terasakiella sp. FCG-A23 TaxID=3080561 RepID=UPI002953EBAC|nr:GatB/YqeY domain-containing protein [Terasakiella sp. A23]MDV7340936.1 GatB/YqeY domain-containing protein [Terasakiella sp. A23]